tara:strand:+ start:320 stop:715 length:396 start_codon:yes stop_codon:yes gene_type:complete
MVFQLESLGDEFVQTAGASVDIEISIACLAVEVVVVLRGDAREFVPVSASGYGHADNFAFVLKSPDGPIDRASSQGIDVLARNRVQFIDRQGASSLFDGIPDGLELLCLALSRHSHSISGFFDQPNLLAMI